MRAHGRRELLKPSASIALHRHSNALVDILPPEADSSISLLSQSERPDVTYQVPHCLHKCLPLAGAVHVLLQILLISKGARRSSGYLPRFCTMECFQLTMTLALLLVCIGPNSTWSLALIASPH